MSARQLLDHLHEDGFRDLVKAVALKDDAVAATDLHERLLAAGRASRSTQTTTSSRYQLRTFTGPLP